MKNIKRFNKNNENFTSRSEFRQRLLSFFNSFYSEISIIFEVTMTNKY